VVDRLAVCLSCQRWHGELDDERWHGELDDDPIARLGDSDIAKAHLPQHRQQALGLFGFAVDEPDTLDLAG
jgi:hypothetical protein